MAARTAAGARARLAAPSSGRIHRLCLAPRVARPRAARGPHARTARPRGAACPPPAWRAGRGAHPPGEKGEGHADLGQRRLWAPPAAALLAGGRLGFVDREGSGRGISTDTNGRWPAREVRLRAGHFTHRGTMDISPAESHLSELLYRYLLTEHGWKGTEVKRIWWQDIEVTLNFLGV